MVKANTYPLFTGLGVLTSEGAQPVVTLKVTLVGKTSVTVSAVTGPDESFKAHDITVDQKTARLEFKSADTTYRVRLFREPDGLWLSSFKTDLPVEALRSLAKEGDKINHPESLVAYALGDSAYIVGLVYANDSGRYVRTDGDWVGLSPTDETHQDMEAIFIDPEKAQAFIEQYDKNFVTVSDAEQYESAEPDTEDSESDNNSDE